MDPSAAVHEMATRETATSSSHGSRGHFHIVGIGASAGGLEALERFFDRMPASPGVACVVIQHLSPDFKSLMEELLSRHTELRIHRVEDGMEIEPNSIYLIPPKKEMIMSGTRLRLIDKDPTRGLSLPIDTFFRSLAREAGSRSIGIILSGTGSDGSRGIQEIHDAGGLIIAQDEVSSKFDGMPKSARETGVVDLVLPPEAMPEALLRYIAHPLGDFEDDDEALRPNLQGMDAIFRRLRNEYGIDFQHYKPNTVRRRVERRMLLSQITDVNDYAEHVAKQPHELNALYKDLLIGVTRFFRDSEAFRRLEQAVIPQLVERAEREEVRVWVAGCATGEEAYSIAMLIHEQLPEERLAERVKIFATDAHRTSLDAASVGCFSDASLAELSPARLERYFTRVNGRFQVASALRKLIVFAPHNIIKDAPFTKLDLISCRNLLIYLEPLAQQKVLSLFHFALNSRGFLFLGPSETPGDLGDEFEAIDSGWRIYRKLRDVRLPIDIRLPLGPEVPRPRIVQTPPNESNVPDAKLLRAYDALLEQFAPPSILINESRELVHCFGGAGKFLNHRDGRPSRDVLDLFTDELRIAVSGALQRSTKDVKPVVYTGVTMQTESGAKQLRIAVKPIADRAAHSRYLLITFEDVSPAERPRAASDEIDMAQASRDQLQSLESELRYAKENLQATIEELETSNEELQATNEELVASNEELQSTNEELHSVNEELYTVNAEYQRKVAELSEMTADMENLLIGTEVGTIFLDSELRIRKYTPWIERTFKLVPEDVGRRIDTFSYNLQDDNLIVDLGRALESRQRIEREVQDRRGNWFFLRILPYRAKAKIEGVVLTLVDIQSLKNTQTALAVSAERYRTLVRAIWSVVWVADSSGSFLSDQSDWERLTGQKDVASKGLGWIDAVHPDDRAALRDKWLNAVRAGTEFGAEARLWSETHKEYRLFDWRAVPLLESDGSVREFVGTVGDVHEYKLALMELRQRDEDLREAVRRRDRFLAMLSHELRNPLSALLNATYLLNRPQIDPKAIAHATGVIQRQATHMAHLLDDLLDVSRITEDKMQISMEPVDVSSLVPDVLETVNPKVQARNQRLDVDIISQPLCVQGNRARLVQIQVNLLTNAIKYTPPGHTITLRIGREGDHAVIRVRDTGLGIEPDMLEAIFDPFVQCHDTIDRSDGGMGVGLTLVRKLVELHSGTVRAHSEGLGRGSEFVVKLPLISMPAAVIDSDEQPAPHGHLRIVLVEDNDDSREMLRSLLAFEGYDVQVAEDGRTGLQVILREKPDVALVDVGLPELNGYEVARRVRAEIGPGGVFLIALTGYGQPEDRRAAADAGFDAHLVKPLSSKDLERILSKRLPRTKPTECGAPPHDSGARSTH